jgi:hypothetical protein
LERVIIEVLVMSILGRERCILVLGSLSFVFCIAFDLSTIIFIQHATRFRHRVYVPIFVGVVLTIPCGIVD